MGKKKDTLKSSKERPDPDHYRKDTIMALFVSGSGSGSSSRKNGIITALIQADMVVAELNRKCRPRPYTSTAGLNFRRCKLCVCRTAEVCSIPEETWGHLAEIFTRSSSVKVNFPHNSRTQRTERESESWSKIMALLYNRPTY